MRLVDFRLWSRNGLTQGRQLAGDRDGYRVVELGRRSLLDPLSECASLFRVTCYDPDTHAQHHTAEHHEYLIAQAVLDATW